MIYSPHNFLSSILIKVALHRYPYQDSNNFRWFSALFLRFASSLCIPFCILCMTSYMGTRCQLKVLFHYRLLATTFMLLFRHLLLVMTNEYILRCYLSLYVLHIPLRTKNDLPLFLQLRSYNWCCHASSSVSTYCILDLHLQFPHSNQFFFNYTHTTVPGALSYVYI